MKTKKP
jgi:hypothetical protein